MTGRQRDVETGVAAVVGYRVRMLRSGPFQMVARVIVAAFMGEFDREVPALSETEDEGPGPAEHHWKVRGDAEKGLERIRYRWLKPGFHSVQSELFDRVHYSEKIRSGTSGVKHPNVTA